MTEPTFEEILKSPEFVEMFGEVPPVAEESREKRRAMKDLMWGFTHGRAAMDEMLKGKQGYGKGYRALTGRMSQTNPDLKKLPE